ncbi:adenylate/guanylate cyclase domain-containing protein [Fusibacter ferrireducens]|uniref:guanylate cyclase n=1 Tax=Fusibacter ferrireducens TaxID=2785058 RepID=A0ABR9ZSF3_9FIRM|nr:adenylate/guanylate cyclase domain-containing protein [Fusibacter ferrireducens]MBF4693387.1 adenylate/guanylate cyclase domain-containing protein [Fusibacter ferrireducens]
MLTIEEQYIDQLTEAIYLLVSGKQTQTIAIPEDLPDNEIRQLYEYFNKMIVELDKASDFSYSLSRGELDYEAPKGKMVLLQSYKNLQASLKHLTWVTQQIAGGDFSHKVDFMGDFSNAFNEMTRQLKEAFETIQQQNKKLEDANATIRADKERIQTLLNSILPVKVIDELNEHGYSAPRYFENVTVFFSDFVGFTKQSSDIDPVTLIDELNSIFKEFDHIVTEMDGERIKTIGDAFLAVWGMHLPLEDHAERAIEAALRMRQFLHKRNENWMLKWEVRIGLHTGNLVGGIVGETKFIYDVFGDTVNIASRMESNSEPMKINISDEVYALVKDKFMTTQRGSIFVKGKGECGMHFVEGRL